MRGMSRQTVSEALLVSLLLLSIAFVPGNSFSTRAESSSTTKCFRLLVIEQMFDSTRMKAAQFFIEELLEYPNWDNSTNECVSYIHLLTMYNYTEVDDAVKPFWRGKLSTPLIQSEITDFLGSAAPGEVVILYYCGHSVVITWPSSSPPHSEFCGISPEQLRTWINTTNLSQTCFTLILDTCYSGYWTEFCAKVSVLAACSKDQMAWGGGWKDGPCGIFTVGLFQGFMTGTDDNDDGWISVAEIFPIAKNFTESHMPNESPECHYGVLEGDLPLLQQDSEMPFPTWSLSINSMQIDPQTAEPRFLVSINVTVVNHGTKNATCYLSIHCNLSEIDMQELTLISEENTTITVVWNTTGFYGTFSIRSTISICPGETDTTDNTVEKWMLIIISGDLNSDRKVDTTDVTLLSVAFNSKPGDINWNPNANIKDDSAINYLDAIILGAHFGRTST